MLRAECPFEAYYISQSPKRTDTQFYPTLPDKYEDTAMYKLFKQSKAMFDSLMRYGNDMYEYANYTNADTRLWLNGLMDDLKQACKHFVI